MLKKSGFTLIELLVVIAIIAILAAILFPVFARARAKAIQNNCLSNAKQLTLACLMYNSDNDETFYFWQNPPLDWPTVITPYVKNKQLFYCGGSNKWQISQWPNCNYAANAQLGNVKSTLVTSPSKIIMVLEADAQNGRLYSAADLTYMYGCSTAAAYDNMTIRHSEGSNYGFVDGHAKWLKPEVISASGACGVNRCGLNPPAEPTCSDWNIRGGVPGQAAIQAAMSWNYAY